MRTQEVVLGDRSYRVHVGSGLLTRAGDLLADIAGRRAIVVTNAIVAAHYVAPLRNSLTSRGIAVDVVLVPDGETHKSWPTLEDIIARLLELRVDRATMLIALGGGVVGDLAGFAAAICLRGLPFVQVPTTLLAQVDSSVGGKTGINHPLGKNMVGAFWQPRAVLIDIDCLRTLPQRELKAGLARRNDDHVRPLAAAPADEIDLIIRRVIPRNHPAPLGRKPEFRSDRHDAMRPQQPRQR